MDGEEAIIVKLPTEKGDCLTMLRRAIERARTMIADAERRLKDRPRDGFEVESGMTFASHEECLAFIDAILSDPECVVLLVTEATIQGMAGYYTSLGIASEDRARAVYLVVKEPASAREERDV